MELLRKGLLIRAICRGMVVVALMLICPGGCSSGKEARPLPGRRGVVNDFTGTLSDEAAAALSATLESYERETCHQIVVLMVSSLDDEAISSFSERVMKAWQIGHPHLENGLLLTLALEEGDVRIDAGSGLDSIVTRGAAERILLEEMVPHFKESRFEEGLRSGLAAFMAEARNVSYAPDLRPAVCR